MPKPVQQHIVFEIGQWTVDSLAHTLSSESEEHRVPPKVMAVLVILAQNHGRLVTRGELIDAVWEGNAYVGENALNNAVWRLRQVLGGDSEDLEVVKTVPKTGYQLLLAPSFLESNAEDVSAKRFTPLHYFAVASVAVVGIVATVAMVLQSRETPPGVDEPLTPVTQLPGRELYAAPSPDGTQFAFMHITQTDGQDLYLQSLGDDDAQPVRFTAGAARYFKPTWAPDSRHLAFLRIAHKGRHCEVVVRDTQLGEEEAIDDCIDVDQRTLSWSPDGRWLVYRKDDPEVGPGLYLRAMSGDYRPREELHARRISCTNCAYVDQEASWSPDSRYLAVTRTRNRLSEDVYRFDVDNWQFTRLTHGEPGIEGHTWDKEGRYVLYVSNKHSLNRRMWVVDTTTKQKREIGYEGAGFPVYLPDYDSIMFYRRSANYYIASIPLGGKDSASHFPRAVAQTSGSEQSPSYSEVTGKLTYYSNISGHNEIWISDPNGTNRQRITDMQTEAIDPSWSPDGTRISFVALDDGTEDMVVHVYDFRSDSISRIPIGFGDLGFPTWSADGESLIVPIWRAGEVDLWRVATDGDQLKRITAVGAEFGRETSDGRYLYYNKAHTRGLFRRPLAGGEELKIVGDIVVSGFGNWALVDNDTVLYARRKDGRSEIVRYEHATGETRLLVRHPGRTVSRYGMMSYSKELEQLFFTHLEPQQIDIVMAADPLNTL